MLFQLIHFLPKPHEGDCYPHFAGGETEIRGQAEVWSGQLWGLCWRQSNWWARGGWVWPAQRHLAPPLTYWEASGKVRTRSRPTPLLCEVDRSRIISEGTGLVWFETSSTFNCVTKPSLGIPSAELFNAVTPWCPLLHFAVLGAQTQELAPLTATRQDSQESYPVIKCSSLSSKRRKEPPLFRNEKSFPFPKSTRDFAMPHGKVCVTCSFPLQSLAGVSHDQVGGGDSTTKIPAFNFLEKSTSHNYPVLFLQDRESLSFKMNYFTDIKRKRAV